MRKWKKSFVTLLLSFALIFTSLPFFAVAAKADNAGIISQIGLGHPSTCCSVDSLHEAILNTTHTYNLDVHPDLGSYTVLFSADNGAAVNTLSNDSFQVTFNKLGSCTITANVTLDSDQKTYPTTLKVEVKNEVYKDAYIKKCSETGKSITLEARFLRYDTQNLDGRYISQTDVPGSKTVWNLSEIQGEGFSAVESPSATVTDLQSGEYKAYAHLQSSDDQELCSTTYTILIAEGSISSGQDVTVPGTGVDIRTFTPAETGRYVIDWKPKWRYTAIYDSAGNYVPPIEIYGGYSLTAGETYYIEAGSVYLSDPDTFTYSIDLENTTSGENEDPDEEKYEQSHNSGQTKPDQNQEHNQSGSNSPSVKVSGIRLSGISKKIAAGEKITLAAAVSPTNANNKTLSWSSSNKKYATVNSKGIVSTKKAGAGKTVTITAKAKDGSGIQAKYKISIQKHAVKSIALKAKSKTVKAGKKLTVKATVKTTGKKANKTLKWSSSNTKYATVSKKGVVTAKKAGKGKTVKITAASTDGTNKKAVIKIKIK